MPMRRQKVTYNRQIPGSCPRTTVRLKHKNFHVQLYPIAARLRVDVSGTDCLGTLVMSLDPVEFRRSAQEPDLQVVRTEFRLAILSVS
jgi:hypothetical protein